MKNIWLKIAAIVGGILGVLYFFLGFKRKIKKPAEIDENKQKINIIKNMINSEKGKRILASKELEELKKVSNGRSKDVKSAKNSVVEVDKKIKDLEQQLRDAGVDI